MLTKMVRLVFAGLMLSAFFAAAVHAQKVTLSVRAGAPGKSISPDLYGLILKLVNNDAAARALSIKLSGAKRLATSVTKTVLTGDPSAVNAHDAPKPLIPETSPVAVGEVFDYEAPANSLTAIRVRPR